MRYGKSCSWIVIGLCVFAGGGCGKKASQQIGHGRFDGPVYHNDYLAFEITIPAEWSIQDRETARKMMRTGEKMMAGGDADVQAALEAGESRTVNLFTAFKYPYGSPVEHNPSINCVAEGVSHLPGIRTGGDYLFHAKRLLQAGQVRFAFPREVYTETVGGVEFHVLAAELLLPTKTVKQEYFATVRKGYTLLLILAYSTDEEKAALRSILDTVKFTPQQ